ncbi:lmbr1 domain containing protein [Grosmannia clavigera kw1407]|uniref:Lmbr1 domain containing protein n=1 Tax=Grosmannia clavigera (strain kw1407 / UAMH 11150) TaxID=655863 RepID=F0XPR6_GROCL|nr:lmbr1 domain containing protein [Grosmannia clavigera kw1407]EFX00387.1 lmbr1 domain containing protein [Grosmannia clavigera kw1407]
MSQVLFAAAATPSGVGSQVFACLALFVLSLVVLLVLRYYLPLRTTPAYLLVPVFFALWLPANIILLVPIDLASSARTDDEATRGIWLPESVLRVAWRITYWLTFALTWTILPILAEYSDAGFREPKDRLLYSLRQNGQYHLMVCGLGLAGLVYVFVTSGASFMALKSLVMALSYCWGLVLAIYLMGHGLVAIPRRLLRTATPSRRLRRLQTQAPSLYEKLEEAEMDLEDIELQVSELSRRKTGSALEFRDWIDELAETVGQPGAHLRPSLAASAPAETRTIPAVITKKYMADVTRQLVRSRHARSRYQSEWTRLLQRYAETQVVLSSVTSQRLDRGSGNGSVLTPYTRFVLHYHVIPYVRTALGVVLALASAAIVWSELVKAALPAASVVNLSVVHHWTGDKGQVGFAGQLIAAGWILYMCTAALASVTEVRVWRGRALVRRNTAHESAFWYASQVARLSIPLSYNFMTFVSPGVYKKTVFYDFLGRLINLTPLGEWFDYVFPAFLLLPVLATLLGLYGKVRRVCGFADRLPDGDDDGNGDNTPHYGTGSWREGRDLIERELDGTSIRQRRQAAAGGGAAVRNSRRTGVDEEAGSTTTPFAVSPSNSGFLPPRTRTLGSGQPRSPAADRSAQQNTATADDDSDSDGNFFQLLGHRMKNTIDTIEPPRWLHDLGNGIKKPRWMGGDDDTASADAPAIRRWFGGSSGDSSGGSDGHIRL